MLSMLNVRPLFSPPVIFPPDAILHQRHTKPHSQLTQRTGVHRVTILVLDLPNETLTLAGFSTRD